jgi:hypothetical protein
MLAALFSNAKTEPGHSVKLVKLIFYNFSDGYLNWNPPFSALFAGFHLSREDFFRTFWVCS